ncbi:MAG: GAF domain-containing sensor histidine kinase [Bacteroidales bacterium]
MKTNNHIDPRLIQFEKIIKRKDLILEVVAKIGQILLCENDLNSNINTSLSLLGNLIKRDRIYVFEMNHNNDVGYLISQRYEWTKKGVSIQIDNPDLQNVRGEPNFTRWIKLFLANKLVRGNISDFPKEEQPLLAEQDIVSILVIPIFIEESCWGFVGFDDCKHKDSWSDGELAILSTLASSIGRSIVKWRRKKELIEAKEKAEQSEKLKVAFLQNISHEIRTPLNSIIGFIDLLSEVDYPQDMQKEYLAIMKTNSHRLLSTLNAIIDVAKIEAGIMSSNFSKVDVENILSNIYNFYYLEASKKGLQLKTELKDKTIVINTDEEKIYAIFTNLIRNAIKYSEKGHITIGYLEHPQNITFYVRDEGKGIPENMLENIFHRFIQVDNTSTKSHEGAGLGLSIVKSYLDQLGGRIWVESKINVGSVFYFSLPL